MNNVVKSFWFKKDGTLVAVRAYNTSNSLGGSAKLFTYFFSSEIVSFVVYSFPTPDTLLPEGKRYIDLIPHFLDLKIKIKRTT